MAGNAPVRCERCGLTQIAARPRDMKSVPARDAGAEYMFFYVPRMAYDHEPMLRLACDVTPQFSQRSMAEHLPGVP
jgi:hypothetical protein